MEVQPGASEPPHGRFGGLFAELQHRELTEQERSIIEGKVREQRERWLEYERRDRLRKVRELRSLFPALESDEDAERALDLCKGDEDLAAERLTEGAAQFMAAIRKTVKSRSAEVAVPSTSAAGSALDGGPGMPAPACSPSPREPDSVVRRTPQTEAAHEMPWRSSRSARVPIRRVGRPEYEECAVFVGAFQSRPRTGGGAQRGGDATPGNQAAEDGGAGQADAPPCGALASDPTCSPGLEVGAPTATKHVPMESPDESPSTRGQGASAAQQGGRSTLRGTAGARPASSKRRRESRVGLSISSGKGSLGRTRRGSVKRAEVLHLGELRTDPAHGWCNSGYIFPASFRARTHFRSSVNLDAVCVHTCEIVAEGGAYFPRPTFRVTASDRPDAPLVAKSPTGCWTAVLRRIAAEIERRRQAGEALAPPPKTAIPGPEYFGLNQPDVVAAIEALDPTRSCTAYWQGKARREGPGAGLGRSEGGGTGNGAGEARDGGDGSDVRGDGAGGVDGDQEGSVMACEGGAAGRARGKRGTGACRKEGRAYFKAAVVADGVAVLAEEWMQRAVQEASAEDHGEGMGCDPSMPAVLLAVPVQGGPEPCSGVQEAQTCPAGSPATPGTGTAPGDDGNAVSPASPVEAARRTKRRRVGRPRKKRISEKDIERDIQVMAAAKWAAVDRRERYERRARRVAVAELSPDPGVVGGEGSSEDGVRLEGYVDPITLQECVDPGTSPDGHVMGMATWKAVLREHGRCPFTQRPLTMAQITRLTPANIDRLRSSLVL